VADKLALLPDVGSGLERVVPEVKTLARPESTPLIAARFEVQRNLTIKALFTQARQEQWPADRLAEAIAAPLAVKLEAPAAQVAQVARYLADEYEQIGDAVLVCSSVTGKAFARISDEDFIQPAPRPRDDGRMITPPKELRPDLHGFLVQWVFDEEREKRLTEALAKRGHQTQLQREDGDSRLLPVTRAGRAEMVEGLRQALPTLLTASAPNLWGLLTRHFDVLTAVPTDSALWPVEKCESLGHITIPISDPKTFNPRFDRVRAIRLQTAHAWINEICQTLAFHAEQMAAAKADVVWRGSVPPEIGIVGAETLITSPDFVRAARSYAGPLIPALADPVVVGLKGRAGAIVLHEEGYDAKAREVFDRWEIGARLVYSLYVDWTALSHFTLIGLPSEAVAEVVR